MTLFVYFLYICTIFPAETSFFYVLSIPFILNKTEFILYFILNFFFFIFISGGFTVFSLFFLFYGIEAKYLISLFILVFSTIRTRFRSSGTRSKILSRTGLTFAKLSLFYDYSLVFFILFWTLRRNTAHFYYYYICLFFVFVFVFVFLFSILIFIKLLYKVKSIKTSSIY